MPASSNKSAPRSGKRVSFALKDSVKHIRAGEGTWENGESTSRRPSAWEVINSERLTEKAFAEIENMERSEKIERQTRRKPVPTQSRFQKDDPRVQASKPRHLAREVTFDDFLNQDQLVDDEPEAQKKLRKASMRTLASSLASIKSASKAFKQKMKLKH